MTVLSLIGDILIGLSLVVLVAVAALAVTDCIGDDE